jgi:sugar diacid utilization regulator
VFEEIREVHGAMIDAVLEGDGLHQVAQLAAELAGGPVAIVIPRLQVACAPEEVRAGIDLPVLRAWVSDRMHGRSTAVPARVVAEAPVRFRGALAGIVVLVRGPEPPRGRATDFLHMAASAALTALAIEDARAETEHNLRGSLLEDLRSRCHLTGPEIVRRAARLGCDLSRGAIILCAELTSDRPHRALTTIARTYPGALAYELDGTPPEEPARVYAALPAGDGADPEATLLCARRLAARLQDHGVVGLSSFHTDPAELRCAVQEAELVLDVRNHSGAQINDDIGSGTYKLLFRMLASHREEAQSFYDATIAPMARYDDQYRTELVRTLQAYLDANCNMNSTAAAIYAHRHTVAYRLDRIRELTGLDPMRSENRERLGLGLKLHRIIAAQLPR